uniref:RNA-directed DNA polymerase, eukaryota, reverse transcriptase zinc-binding domain protein n=1 Tax=Tanacetum cinerariifolium TaxID=118510 RepID=A0A699I1M7_TANCI|nr:RNA-directed DNA polymerase, eukaryota, reverse transcriptase zinc-binding domain protein [Tanacetum cinerariifolium]
MTPGPWHLETREVGPSKYPSQQLEALDGRRVEGNQVPMQFVSHFNNFLGTSIPVNPLSSLGDIVQLKLTKAKAIGMIHEVSDKEIKDAMFDIDSSKAAGPMDIHHKGRILGEINATLIALDPKIDNPNKDDLSKVVSMNQSAFILGRHIQDNNLITQELLKGYNRKNRAKRCAMKIDIQKTCDNINWDFIKEVMLYHIGCKELKLTHMCFADDLIVLCNGDVDSLKVVKKSLDDFSSISGLHSNLSKSTIFFDSINERDKGDLLQILPFKCGKLPMKYLGVPLLAKRLGVKDCKSLIENVENKINCWKNKNLSYAGRIQLIASVLSTMQQYWASVYNLPLTVIKELNKLLKRFLWNSRNSAKGKARVAWNLVCRPKDQGCHTPKIGQQRNDNIRM